MSAVVGLAFGVALDIVTMLVASPGPAGEGWSFRGNGALVVPIGFGAAVLAGGWTGVSLFGRGVTAWLGFAFAIGAAAAIPSFAWPVLSLVLAVALQLFSPSPRRLSAALTVLAGVAFTLGLGAGFRGAEAVL